ncbi:MAG: spore maturation protein [Bacillota bacterium]|nr:spore maturation protein [Bacillota bacterium]
MNIIKWISDMIIPIVITGILVAGLYKKADTYDIFIEGAKEGIGITVGIVPSIIGLMMAISMMRACGMIDLIAHALKPVLSFIGMPADVLPLALLRPMSGSASLGIVTDILKNSGADSYSGRVASIMMGSTETTFYTIALFFGSVNIKNTNKAVSIALIGDAVGMLGSIIFCRLFFGK